MLSFEHGASFSLRTEVSARFGINLRIRGMTREGPFTLSHVLAAAGNLQLKTFRIPDMPVVLTIDDPEQIANQGNAYVRATLLLNDDPLYDLVAGFVYSGKALTWPSISSPDMRPGGGTLRAFTGSNPAAGAQVSETVPTGFLWHVLGARLQLTTDANAANRRVHIRFIASGLDIAECIAPIDQTASLIRKYHIGQYGDLTVNADDDDILVAMPADVWLPSASTISTTTTNIQATDDFISPNFIIEEFFMPIA